MGQKLVFLTKRRPMGRDLIRDPYGRFFHIPRGLASLGYDVSVIAFSYEKSESLSIQSHGIQWHSVSMQPNFPLCLRTVIRILNDINPDWIVGCSDTYFGIAAQWFAERRQCRAAIDAYDNYCAYMPWATPLHRMFMRAVGRCDLTTVAGPSLAKLFDSVRDGRPSVIVPMAADPNGFYLRDRNRCRNDLGLPYDAPIVGYSGSINRQRGIEQLFEAIEYAREVRPDVTLVLSGRREKGIVLPENCIDVGYVANGDVPKLLNSFDVMAVINTDSAFGNFSYPVKLYEAMACRIPVVVSRTESTAWMLRDHSDLLVPSGDPGALCGGILHALTLDRVAYSNVADWDESVEVFHRALH